MLLQDHERTIREFRIDSAGISIGAPMTSFTGILSGNPVYIKNGDGLIDGDHDVG